MNFKSFVKVIHNELFASLHQIDNKKWNARYTDWLFLRFVKCTYYSFNTSFLYHNMSKEKLERLSDCFSTLLFCFLAFFVISKKLLFQFYIKLMLPFFLRLLEFLFKAWFPLKFSILLKLFISTNKLLSSPACAEWMQP